MAFAEEEDPGKNLHCTSCSPIFSQTNFILILVIYVSVRPYYKVKLQKIVMQSQANVGQETKMENEK